MSKNQQQLGRKIGLFSLIGLGVGATVGSGIFSTISNVAAVAGSSLFLVLAFAVGSLLQIPASLCYAELASAYPEDGGQYVYFREAGSRPLAFICGWLTFLAADGPAIAVMALAISNYMSVLLPFDSMILRCIAVCIVIFFALLHIRSVEFGGIVQAIINFLKILPFIIIICAGIVYLKTDLFMSAEHASSNVLSGRSIVGNTGIIALFSAITMTTYSFDGMFAACYVSGEVKNPKKNLPVSLISTAIIVLFLYVGLSASASGLMSIDEISMSSAPIADMVSKIPVIGDIAHNVIAILAIIVIIGAVSSCLLYMPRIEYAMAKDGLFFKVFGKVHNKFQTPYMAIIIFTIYVIILTFFTDLNDLLSYLTLIVLAKNCASIFTIFVLRKKDNYKPSYKCPGGYIMPIIACSMMFLMVVFAFIGCSIYGVLASLITILVGLVAYKLWDKR